MNSTTQNIPSPLFSHPKQHQTLSKKHPMATSDKGGSKEEVGETSEHLNTQAWVFKVSIHCQGCKRKVQKIIQNIPGVRRSEIDLKQHKVSVYGDVDPGTVIWNLEKAGKHAELWPEKPVIPKESKSKTKGKNREKKQSVPQETPDQTARENQGKEKRSAKREVGDGEGKNAEDAASRTANGGGGQSSGNGGDNNGGEGSRKGSYDGKVSDGGEGEGVAAVEGGADAEAREKTKQAAAVPSGGRSSTNANEGKIEDGSGGKKKNIQGQNGKTETCDEGQHHPSENVAAAGVATGGPIPNVGQSQTPMENADQVRPRQRKVRQPEHGSPNAPAGMMHNEGHRGQGPIHVAPDDIPPYHHGYEYEYPSQTTHYNGPPVYAVSHHTAHPTSSYGAYQYCAPQPPLQSYHAYLHPGPEDQPPPHGYDTPYHLRPSDSFELFSDENPNACSLM